MVSVMFKDFDVKMKTTMEISKHLNLLDVKMAIFVIAVIWTAGLWKATMQGNNVARLCENML